MAKVPCGYFIREGVRRSVVAREAGETEIEAIIEVSGHPDRLATIPLADLHHEKRQHPSPQFDSDEGA